MCQATDWALPTLVWEEDAQIKAQIQWRQVLSRAGQVAYVESFLRRAEEWARKRDLNSVQE